jgi:hypothetical protein
MQMHIRMIDASSSFNESLHYTFTETGNARMAAHFHCFIVENDVFKI